MKIKVGTFNLNNLFSRFNFKGNIADGETITSSGVTTFTIAEGALTLRTFNGKLVEAKPEAKRKKIAERIKEIDLDVLALAEVEDLGTLETFVATDLDGLYPFVTLIEGNDDRLIDVALLSKFPLGAVTSWKHRPDPDNVDELLFGRDLLQVEILSKDRKSLLFTMFVNHLKSKLVFFDDPDPEETEKENNRLRTRQAEAIADVIRKRLAADARFIIAGDMNDSPDAVTLAAIRDLEAVNALANPKETRPYPNDDLGNPPTKSWTHRFVKDGAAHYELLDHIWLSPSLANLQLDAFIERRVLKGGDGSDHDPAWVVLDL